MSRETSWATEYETLIGRMPEIVGRSRLTIGAFSLCLDVYLSLAANYGPLNAAAQGKPEAASLLAELKRRAVSGIGGEVFLDWPGGAAWIDAHASGRRAIGGTSAQAAYMLATLGAPALIAIENRSADQLSVLHPETLAATEAGLVPVGDLQPDGAVSLPHYIFEFTAGETIDGAHLPRSSRTIVRFDHSALQRDEAFVRASTARAGEAGAGILCGFNEIPPERAAEELDYAAGIAAAWRRSGLPLLHLELGDFPTAELHEQTLQRLLPCVTSFGTSRSELAHLRQGDEPLHATAIRLAESRGLERVCVHADEWAFAVTRHDAARELQALQMGCLLAAARAANGYFAIPKNLPEGAQLSEPPLPAITRVGDWSVACCPSPYLVKPVATIGLGDTFLAGTLLVLGGDGMPASTASAGRGPALHPALPGARDAQPASSTEPMTS